MQPNTFALRVATTVASALCLAAAAHATEQAVITNAKGAASAVSSPTADRTLKFNTRQAVPAKLTSRRDTAIANRWKAQVRFAGQTEFHECEFNLPKNGQLVQRGEAATGTLTCTTPWQLYDNGLAFDAFENGHKVADGTLRP
jgi:hypothetical protein